jgi:hypothetical protein
MDKMPPLPAQHVTPPPVTSPVSRQPAPTRRTRRRRTLVVASATAVILGALVIVRYGSAPADDAAAVDEPDRLEQAAAVAPDVEPVPAAPAPAATPAARAAIAAPVVKKQPKKATTETPAKNRAASAKSTAPIAVTAIAKAPAKGNAAAPTAQARFVSTESVGPAPVTLTGCLEMTVDRDEFRLSDPEGADAPRARSWRTGFLKKRPTPVALVEPPDPHGLQVQVGKRVAATGTLIDRELKVSSVAVVGSSCD